MTYHATTVTLENFGGIVAQKDKYGMRTVGVAFNVTVAGKRQYAVQLRGAPRLENGMVVTAVLHDTENWQTLVGWLNHSTGEICGVDSPEICFWWFVASILMSALLYLESIHGSDAGARVVVWSVMVVAMNAWTLFSWRRSAKVYRLLKP